MEIERLKLYSFLNIRYDKQSIDGAVQLGEWEEHLVPDRSV